MKIYLHRKGVSLVGKPWEIRRKLKEYSTHYHTVAEWIHDEKKDKDMRTSSKVIPFPSRVIE